MANTSHPPRTLATVALLAAFLLGAALAGRAQVNFDVFVGHGLGQSDGAVTEGSWFPVTCEIQNDGPSFHAVVEITAGQFGSGQTRLIPVELPTNTRKRFTVPVYCPNRYRISIDGRLINEKRKTVAERTGVEPRVVVDWQSPLIGSLSRTHRGAAALPEGAGRNAPQRPATTHLSTELFPDNPLTLESLSMVYLHSARAVELKEPQVTALLAWLHNGGHLVVAIEEPGDANSVPWLRGVLPCVPSDVVKRRDQMLLHEWVTNVREDQRLLRPKRRPANATQGDTPNPFTRLTEDPAFSSAEMPVVTATLRDGTVLIGSATTPLAVTAQRGRGQLTVLLFSPELEPFNSWQHRNWFWAKLGDVPVEWLAAKNVSSGGTMPLDGVFGAMVDTRQIRKLPIGWLLLLLLAYLIVIGPLDQYWLKKINRQMLTWITFPSYVVLFSLLIYFIGYKLRSGEMEWNELHVVDVTPHGTRADLRGRAYCSAYSPVNARYDVAADQTFSALRGEIGQGAAQEISKAVIEQRGNGFAAQLSVPVWTSQLFVNDWWRQGTSPLHVEVVQSGSEIEVRVQNTSGKKIPSARLVHDGRQFNLGDITHGTTNRFPRAEPMQLQNFVQNRVNQFSAVVQQRQNQFGGRESGRLEDVFENVSAASFLALANTTSDGGQPWNQQYWNRFVTPPGFDLSPLINRGEAILLAWMPGELIVPPLNKFTPRYSKKDTVLRINVPVTK